MDCDSPRQGATMEIPSQSANSMEYAPELKRIDRDPVLFLSSHLHSLDEDETGSFSTHTPACFVKTYHHQEAIIGDHRNPWNSPDAAGRSKDSEMSLVPPPPPPPPRRIRIASIENFHPTHTIFSKDFSDDESDMWDVKKRCLGDELEQTLYATPSPLHKRPKLAMKRTDHYNVRGDPLNLEGALAATRIVS